MAELERYFIHGRYHHLLYFFRFPPSFTVTYLINCTTINSKIIICWSDMGNHCCLRKSSAIFDNGTNKAISRYNVGVPQQRVTIALIHFLLFSSSCLQGSQGYPGRRVTLSACYRDTLAGGLSFSPVNAPGRVNPPTRVNVLIVSRLFDHALSWSRLQG